MIFKYLDNTNTLCILYDAFVSDDPAKALMMTKDAYDKAKGRGSIIVHGRGGNGRQVHIEYETLPLKYKELVKAKYGDPYKAFVLQPLKDMVKLDMEARAFYAGYRLSDGRQLPVEYQTKYSRQCDWLNMISVVLADKKELKEVLRISIAEFWENVITAHKSDPINPGLPTSEKRLKERIKLYSEKGKEGLIEAWRWNNDHARKVDDSIEQLILALYRRHDKPYFTTVVADYKDFIEGKFHLVNKETGELFEPAKYYVDGEPYEVTYATVKHYIEKPANRAAVDKERMSALEFTTQHRPYHTRKAPEYSFSKITMDDISIPFEMPNGKRAWSYQVFDVASQAVIGVAFAKDKTEGLIMDSLRDMFSLIARKGWGMPFEIEVEQHLNANLKGKANTAGVFEADILTEGNIFPFVTFCAPRNPQQKRAEGFINLKKYGFQKLRDGFKHRPFGRKEANRHNEDAKPVYYTYEQIKANELADIAAYNAELHPDQNKYPGLSRWQVLEQTLNPQLQPVNMALVMQFIAHKQATSVSRGYAQLKGGLYKLADQSKWLEMDAKGVVAHYLTNHKHEIEYVYLFTKNGEPICQAIPVERFNEAKAEQTQRDKQILGSQKAYLNTWDKMVNNINSGVVNIGKASVEATERFTRPEPVASQPNESKGDMQENTANEEGFVQKSEPSKPWFMDDDALKNRAKRGI